MSEQLLTTVEAAAILKVTPSTVNRYARVGILHAFSLPGKQRRYRREEVEAILISNQADGAA